MSLICGDGFDHYPYSLLLSKWDYNNNNACDDIGVAYGRLGSQGARVQGSFQSIGQGGIRKNLPITVSSYGFTGAGFRAPTLSSGACAAFTVFDVGVSQLPHIGVFIQADGAIAIATPEINNFSTNYLVWATSSPGIMAANAFRHIEAAFHIHNVSGEVIVRVDETIVVSYAGNTRRGAGNIGTPSTNNYFTGVSIGGAVNGGFPIHVDDWYFADDSGVRNNTFLGDVHLGAIYPDGIGNLTEWTPVGVANNWDAVNETSPDDDTTYNKTTVLGAIDLFTMQNTAPTVANIKGLLCNGRVYKDDATARGLALMVRHGGVSAELPMRAAPGAYVNLQNVSETNPSTGNPWTPAEVDAMEYGIRLKY